MGNAVRTRQDQDPLLIFEWVHQGVHEDLRAAVIALISGHRLVLEDDLEIHALTGPSADRVRLILLRPNGPFKVDIELEAVESPGPEGDPRASLPVPDRWRSTTATGKTVWELFQCTVHNVTPHNNTP